MHPIPLAILWLQSWTLNDTSHSKDRPFKDKFLAPLTKTLVAGLLEADQMQQSL